MIQKQNNGNNNNGDMLCWLRFFLKKIKVSPEKKMMPRPRPGERINIITQDQTHSVLKSFFKIKSSRIDIPRRRPFQKIDNGFIWKFAGNFFLLGHFTVVIIFLCSILVRKTYRKILSHPLEKKIALCDPNRIDEESIKKIMEHYLFWSSIPLI